MNFMKNVAKKTAALSVASLIFIYGASFSVYANDNSNEPLMPDTEDIVLVLDSSAQQPSEQQIENAENSDITYYYTMDRVNFRKSPNTSAEIIKTLDIGMKVQFVGYAADDSSANAWSEVIYNNTRGYIKSEYISSTVKSESGKSAVQLLEWSKVKQIFTIGVPAEVYDVRTGLTYYVKSFSNGLHADVEPVTKEDTSIMKKTFNNTWDWDPRPVWVTINGYTIAGSINGMPHGGGVISDNGMDGQVCIHFRGSSTHNGNTAFGNEHQKAVTEAWNAVK